MVKLRPALLSFFLQMIVELHTTATPESCDPERIIKKH